MNPPTDRLSEALRELAAASPQAPSAELGERLRNAFAHHHARRRHRQVTIAVCLAACLVIATGVLWKSRPVPRITAAKETAGPSAPVAAATSARDDKPLGPSTPLLAARDDKSVDPRDGTVSPSTPPRLRSGSARDDKSKRKRAPSEGSDEATPTVVAEDFVALPTFDPAVSLEQSRMVRLDLPGSALQLIGYPVDGQLLDRRVLADVLVGQDGVPYAVRLVQTQGVH